MGMITLRFTWPTLLSTQLPLSAAVTPKQGLPSDPRYARRTAIETVGLFSRNPSGQLKGTCGCPVIELRHSAGHSVYNWVL